MTSTQSDEHVILWISLDSQDQLYALNNECSTRIVHYLDHGELCPPWFERLNVMRIREQLGNTSTYAHSGANFRALHQSIVMTEILRHRYPFTVTYMRSTHAALTMLAKMTRAEKKKIITWLDAIQGIHPYVWMHAYDALTNECVYIYPPRHEVTWADFKIYDMHAFDRIANLDGAFRPLTCYPGA
jgi:hypothetical protein